MLVESGLVVGNMRTYIRRKRRRFGGIRRRFKLKLRRTRRVRRTRFRRRSRKPRIPKTLYNELNPVVTDKWEQGTMVNAKSVGTKVWGLTYPTGNMFDAAYQMQLFGALGTSLEPNVTGTGNTWNGAVSSNTATATLTTGTLRRSLYIKKHTVSTVFHNCTNGKQYYTAYYCVAKRDVNSYNCRALAPLQAQQDRAGAAGTWTSSPTHLEPIFDHSFGENAATTLVASTDVTIGDMLHRGMCSTAAAGAGAIKNAGQNVLGPPVGSANAYYMYKSNVGPNFYQTGTTKVNEAAVGPSTVTDPTHGEVDQPTGGGLTDRNSYVYHKDCTPFRSTEFLSYFKIYKVKKFAIDPGQTKILKQSSSKKKIPYQWLIENTFLGTNTSNIGDSRDEVWAMKGVTKFILFSQVGSVVTADTATMPVVGTPAWLQYSMSTANTCTGLIHRMKFTTRLLRDQRKWLNYRQNFGVLDYQLASSYAGYPGGQIPVQPTAHHLNVKVITATNQTEADVPVNPT